MSEMSFFMSEMYIIIIINKKRGDFMKKINYYLRLQVRLRCSDDGLPEYIIKKFFKNCPFFVLENEFTSRIDF